MLQYRPSSASWIHIGTLIAGLIVIQYFHANYDLAWDRIKIEHGEYWRLIGGHFTHNNISHLALNCVGIILVLQLINAEIPGVTLIHLTLLIALLTGLFLFLWEPQLMYYVGFSAVLHGMLACFAVSTLPKNAIFGIAILSLLALKLVFEGQPQFTANLIDIRVATEAHFWGFVSGILVGGLYTGFLYWQKNNSLACSSK